MRSRPVLCALFTILITSFLKKTQIRTPMVLELLYTIHVYVRSNRGAMISSTGRSVDEGPSKVSKARPNEHAAWVHTIQRRTRLT